MTAAYSATKEQAVCKITVSDTSSKNDDNKDNKKDDGKNDDAKKDDSKNDNTKKDDTTSGGSTTGEVTVTGTTTKVASWDEAVSAIAGAAEGSVITINVSDTNDVISGSVLNTLAGKNVVLQVALENGITWKIDGRNLAEGTNYSDISLGVVRNSNAVPAGLISKLPDVEATVQISLEHNGAFGFEMVMNVPLGTEYAGLYANLYYYNKETNALEFVKAVKIGEDGSADLSFAHAPDRFFDCGIAEGNMMTVAAGLAAAGKVPFASTFAMFAAGRAFEQIRNSIAYPHLNVKIGATHAGITVGEDGATHQCLEDIGTMRTIPGMAIVDPADATEARAAVEWAINYVGPVYLRFGRLAVPVLFDKNDYKFEFGKNIVLRDGKDVTIMATGITVAMALEAAKMLDAEGISARVVNVHTIKPIDADNIAACAAETGAIVTAEEHNIIGGLGSAVSEVVCERRPVPVLRVGVEDSFGRSGKVPALLEMYGLTPAHIAEKAKAAIKMKSTKYKLTRLKKLRNGTKRKGKNFFK